MVVAQDLVLTVDRACLQLQLGLPPGPGLPAMLPLPLAKLLPSNSIRLLLLLLTQVRTTLYLLDAAFLGVRDFRQLLGFEHASIFGFDKVMRVSDVSWLCENFAF